MTDASIHTLVEEALQLLENLVCVPSLSRKEEATASLLQHFLNERGIHTDRIMNNIFAINKHFDKNKPSILLNSHHDTVAPNELYTLDPYLPLKSDGKLFGLGTTDAGASLVSLIACFIYFYEKESMPFNLVLAASAEEEISGVNGIERLFGDPGFSAYFEAPGSFAIIGEPTQLELAVAEKGLLVLDCIATGKAGHAARDEGDNAIYKAINAIDWIRNYRFTEISPLLGENKMTVTSIQTENKAHNIIPATCTFVIDVRLTEKYTHSQVIDLIRINTGLTVTPRSTRLNPSSIPEDHPVVKAGARLGKKIYGSPTLSDQALIPLLSLKCGPGFSAQSHQADEYVLISDVKDGVLFYIQWIDEFMNACKPDLSANA